MGDVDQRLVGGHEVENELEVLALADRPALEYRVVGFGQGFIGFDAYGSVGIIE